MDIKFVLFDSKGRMGRQNFWIGWAIMFVASIVLGWIPIVGFIVGLALIYVGICVYGKRLHDMGKSAWLYGGLLIASTALWIIIVAIAAMTGLASSGDPGFGMAAMMGSLGIFGLLMFLVWIAFTIWVGVSNSQPGDNKYGSPPPVAPAAPPPGDNAI